MNQITIQIISALLLLSGSVVADERKDFFEKKIRPVLVKKCYRCHSAVAVKKGRLGGGLQLDTRAGIRAGGETGPAVVPGSSRKSLLIAALRHQKLEMPPNEKLSPTVIADFVTWIETGAADPREGKPIPIQTGIDYEKGRKHWCDPRLRPVEVTTVKDKTWPRGKIDHYILARIEKSKLQPADDAEPLTLLRRLGFALTGLPPSLEQAKRFEALSSTSYQSEYKRVVDELLNSARFGEHWARHWLDGVRYDPQVETSAFYRNWVINAFNQDMPYNEFLRKQIAGDLLPATNDKEKEGNILAAQMLVYNRTEADPVEASLEVLGQQMLGISLNCARCHDHKFDAVSQEDYYALAGILKSSKYPKSARDGLTIPSTSTKVVAIMDEKPNRIGPTHFLEGGDSSRRGKLIPRRLPRVFFAKEPSTIESKKSGRLELANWIGDANNSLTARVMANRIWQRLIGYGIVRTPNDFGTNGEAPTHPQLLDYLATVMIKSNWSIKAVIREIVLSRTYQQSVVTTASTKSKDHANKLFTRAVPTRLQYEQIMDQLLSVAGRLESGMVQPVLKINKWPKHRRKDKTYGGPRAIYVRADDHLKRTFDGPNTELLMVRRARSVTAPQALYFLNSEMLRELSPITAQRIRKLSNSQKIAVLIQNAYRVLFTRLPVRKEQDLGAEFIGKYGFDRYVHALLCTNELIHLN